MRYLLSFVLAAFAVATIGPVRAAEGGAGAYLLGLRNTGAGITPPPGVFISDQHFFYQGSISGRLPTEGGLAPSAAHAEVSVNIPTLMWVTQAEILGGRLGFSATTPFGRLAINGKVGPFSLEDSSTTYADPIISTFVGWRAGDLHWQLGASGYMPWGNYEKGALANIAKHRLALDLFGSLTYFNKVTGIDVTNAVGFTFNAENSATSYKSGNELHWDWGVSKRFDSGLSIGAIGYVYRQLTDDSGSGAALGGLKGKASAIGASVGYDFTIGVVPVSTRARYYHEFAVEDRLQGEALYLSASMPLWVAGAK